jgi:acyl-CoA synthetase (AMP-forming)/AMP-acid ligase II
MRNLVLVPLSSSFGSCGMVTLARHGGTLLLQGGFDAAAAVRMLGRYRPTLVLGVPTMLARMAGVPAAPEEDLSALRALVSSGAALPAGTAEACRARFRRPVINVYGSADGVNCHTASTRSTTVDSFRRGDGTGARRPDPAVAEIRIVDVDGRPLPPGEAGEICALGPMTPLCYVNAPELDARYRDAGGRVRTGDRGLLDAEGTLHVLDRLKQIVIRGGENISPAEVERELRRHPAVGDAACLGVPDADLGERLCAFVVPQASRTPTLAELNGFLAAERGLSRRKLPELLVTLAGLPTGPTGKVCRRTLAALAGERSGQRRAAPPGTDR